MLSYVIWIEQITDPSKIKIFDDTSFMAVIYAVSQKPMNEWVHIHVL